MHLCLTTLAAVLFVKGVMSALIVIENGVDPDFHYQTGCFVKRTGARWADYAQRHMGTPPSRGRRDVIHRMVRRQAGKLQTPGEFGDDFAFPIFGTLSCTEHNVEFIHLRRVVMGYTPGNQCGSPWEECAQEMPLSVIGHCEGADEKCVFEIVPRMHPDCALPTNFIFVDYECMNGDELVFDICKYYHTMATNGTVAVKGPGWPFAPSVSAGAMMSCQCELTAPPGSTIQLEYMQSATSGSDVTCNQETVLFEGRSSNKEPYVARGEVCGKRNVAKHNLFASQVRVTYLANGELQASPDRRGFMSKLSAVTPAGHFVPLTAYCGQILPTDEDYRHHKFALRV